MIYQINYACGHSLDMKLSPDPVDARDAVVDLEGRLCPSCEKAQKKANREADRDEVDALLPPLEGTPKQVAWARRIRADFFLALTEIEKEPAPEYHREMLHDIRSDQTKRTKAKYWIEFQKLCRPTSIEEYANLWWLERRTYYVSRQVQLTGEIPDS